MQGVGMGYAAEPLLHDLATIDPTRHAEAVVRSAEFFNCNPLLAGLALGALVRAEYDGIEGEQVSRLRTALCGPLGSLGDQFFWAGLVPALMAAAIISMVFGAGLWAALAVPVIMAAVRLLVGRWSLATGLASGMKIAGAVTSSWLPAGIRRISPLAAGLVGLAAPIAAGWYLDRLPLRAVAAAVVLTAAAVAAVRWLAPRSLRRGSRSVPRH